MSDNEKILEKRNKVVEANKKRRAEKKAPKKAIKKTPASATSNGGK